MMMCSDVCTTCALNEYFLLAIKQYLWSVIIIVNNESVTELHNHCVISHPNLQEVRP